MVRFPHHVLGGLVLAWVANSGCLRAGTSVAGPTALERQMMGAYEALDRELLYEASFRGPPHLGPRRRSAFQERALEARAIQTFNRDDVAFLKGQGCVGESLSGRLVRRPCSELEAPYPVVLVRVLEEEEIARRALFDWAALERATALGRKIPTQQDRLEVERLYGRLQREAAEPGHWVEIEAGRWTRLGGP